MDLSPAQTVIILDFGAQYTQLIARRVRECHVYCELLPYDTPLPVLRERRPVGIILSGGPPSVYERGAPQVDPSIYGLGIPILGICYGMQLMAQQLGGRVVPGEQREYGRSDLEIQRGDGLFSGLPDRLVAWMSHGDRVEAPPPGFEALARSANSPVAAMGNRARRLFGVQFHPEVTHTPWGSELLRNFLCRECGCEPSWTMGSFLRDAVAAVRDQVGNGRAVCALSGGVDSAVAAALVHRAVGDRLTCVFVNHGLLRSGEPESVRQTFAEHFRIPLVYVDAAQRFLERLRGVTDPEEKRRRIGEEFIRVFEEEAHRLGEVRFLVQGTLYPDVIESGPGHAATIKTHHNVGGLPERMHLRLIEPLRWLFKDEVRALGEELGLPEEIIWRHPFPGPGLAIRVVGEVTGERLEILRHADAIVMAELRASGYYQRLAQALVVLAPVRSVGVMGDQRSYAYPVILRAVTSEDFMTADWARLPFDLLERLSNRVVNEVPGVNRFLYDLTSKPPATIEWE
ncbi:MAG: glutamine-hydrolyzing GMP synthase [Armatimonadetes bacterium]|nr:glutamine-hydrolyzing GMP synthase [Armatimonadota bacterium]